MRVRLAVAIVGTIGGLAMAAPAARGADPGEQIAALQKIKQSLTPAERKLDSRIAVDLRTTRLKSGTVEVDIVPASPDIDLTERLLALGANVRYASPHSGDIRAAVPERKLKTVAGWGEVKRVDRAGGYLTAHYKAPRETKAERSARLDAALEGVTALATVTSEGDRTHAADTVRARDRVTGVGTKLCALSDGVDSLAASQAAGELPAVDVLPGQAGEGDEGTAMLQILHDLAPGAELGFATAYPSPAAFADNIRRAALPGRLRRDRRRHPLLQREPVPGRPDRPGGQRRHRRRRALLQLRRQLGQHARRHRRPLRGRVPRLRPDRRQDRRRGPRLRSRPGRAGLQPVERVQHRRVRDDVLGRAARRRRPPTTTSMCSTAPATS